jgi:predicted component of type VI protein secretion system
MPAQLVALTEGPSILLDKPILLIGRHPECDIQIESRKISRRHCCVAQVNDYLIVRDLGSTNGIRINGVRVMEGRLAAGDELTIGNYRYRVTFEAQAQPGPAPGRPRDTFRGPLSVSEVADDLLEACDEPVPLAEPESPRPAALHTPHRSSHLSPPPPGADKQDAGPERLDMMPGKDAFPKIPSQPSGSHHPG